MTWSRNAEAMRAAAGGGYSTATDLADWLVRTLKLPFREAHHVTGPHRRSGGSAEFTLGQAPAVRHAGRRAAHNGRRFLGAEPGKVGCEPGRAMGERRHRTSAKWRATGGSGWKRGLQSAKTGLLVAPAPFRQNEGARAFPVWRFGVRAGSLARLDDVLVTDTAKGIGAGLVVAGPLCLASPPAACAARSMRRRAKADGTAKSAEAAGTQPGSAAPPKPHEGFILDPLLR